MEEEIETIPEPQQIVMVQHSSERLPEQQQIVTIEQSSETKTLKDTLHMDDQIEDKEVTERIEATPAPNQGADHTDRGTPSLMVNQNSHSLVIHNYNFSMQLDNVSDDIVANNLKGNVISVLSPV